MKTKIISLVAAVALFSFAAQAQITFGVRAGVNFQNINGKNTTGDKLENGMIIGFNAGANVEIPVADEFYLQPGLLFTTKGAVDKEIASEPKINLSYIELPINLVYKPLLGSGHMLLGFGPYVGYGILGKVKGETSDTDIDFKSEVEAGDPTDVAYFKALDAGANLLVGYEFAFNLSFQLNAQLGLLEINPKTEVETDLSQKNTGFGVSLGYRF